MVEIYTIKVSIFRWYSTIESNPVKFYPILIFLHTRLSIIPNNCYVSIERKLCINLYGVRGMI
jgi:hypothetical protein